MRLKSKVAVITGSSRGIGREIAILFAGEGAQIVINFVQNDNAANEVVEEIKNLGADVLSIKTSVTDKQAVDKMFKKVYEKFGKIDILVNNAGVLNVGYFAGMAPRDWLKVIDINLNGCYNCSKSVLTYMKPVSSGKIINISSYAGVAGLFNLGHAVYAASKAAVIGFTKALAKEVAPHGISVKGIAPGLIDTDMLKFLPAQIKGYLSQNIPMKRLGLAKEIAALTLFLASDDSSYIQGEIVIADGGWLS